LDGPAIPKVIHQLSGGGEINPTASQSDRHFLRGPIVAKQLFGELDIGLQNIVCHATIAG
jgi:hypothetical protein